MNFKKLFLFCTHFKNALLINKKYLMEKNTNFIRLILNILWDNGYILFYKIYQMKLKITFKYYKNKPIINFIKFYKKTTKRIYFSVKQLLKFKYNKNLDFLFSTSYGLKNLTNCKKFNIGGNLLLIIL